MGGVGIHMHCVGSRHRPHRKLHMAAHPLDSELSLDVATEPAVTTGALGIRHCCPLSPSRRRSG